MIIFKNKLYLLHKCFNNIIFYNTFYNIILKIITFENINYYIKNI